MPLINWHEIKSLYTTVTDPFIWDLSKFYEFKSILNKENDEVLKNVAKMGKIDQMEIFTPTDITKDLIPNIKNQLRDKNYSLFFN